MAQYTQTAQQKLRMARWRNFGRKRGLPGLPGLSWYRRPESPRTAMLPSSWKRALFGSIRAMFQRQLDSKTSWSNFEQQLSPSNVRSRLYRLDPPFDGEYVELYEYKRLHQLNDWPQNGPRPQQQRHIQELADTLIANLFFFEPDDIEATTLSIPSQRPIPDPS